MNVLKILLLSCSSLVLFTSDSAAQGFHCFGGPYPTLRRDLENSDVIVSGNMVCSYPANHQWKFPGMTVFTIQKVEKDESESFAEEQLVAVPYPLDLSKEKTFRIPGNFDDQGTFSWGIDSNEKLSSQVFQYLIESPEQTKSEVDRLEHYFWFLEHTNTQIAVDAAREFQFADTEDLFVLSKTVDSELLRKRIAKKGHTENHEVRSSYAIMLGKCGNDIDAEYLKAEILNYTGENRSELSSLMFGYLLLTGEEGLDWLDVQYIQNEDCESLETFAAFIAIQAMWTYGDYQISPDRLRQSMRILLDRPSLADLVIVELAQWNDWTVMDRLMDMYDEEEYQDPFIKRAIVRFMLIAEKDGAIVAKGELPEHVKKAAANLKKLRHEDPNTVQRAKRYFFD